MSRFDAKGTKHVTMFDVRANGNTMHGISFAGEKLELHQGEFSRNGSDGISLDGGELFVVDTTVESNGGHGVLGMNLGKVELDNPRFADNTFSGALFDGADSITATDVRAVANAAEGMIIDHTTGAISISRSWFTDNKADGLIVADTGDVATLTNVAATDNAGNGLHVTETTAATLVKGGVFEKNGGNGMNLLDVGSITVGKNGANKTEVNRNGGHGLTVTGSRLSKPIKTSTW